MLTVLDFVGQHRAEYRFDVRYRAITGSTRAQLESQLEQGFPHLPPGSQLVLDAVSQQIVLGNVRTSLQMAKKDLLADVRTYAASGGAPTLQHYLEGSGREVADVYRDRGTYGGWTALLRAAGLPTVEGGPDEAALLKRVATLVHVDDGERAAAYGRFVTPGAARYEELSDREQRLARMLFFALWPNRGGFGSYEEGFAHLRRHPAVVAEVQQLMAGAKERARHVPRPLSPALAHVPVLSHATYRRDELLAGFDYANEERSTAGHVSGVAWCEPTSVDALLINLRKDERAFTPTTMYRDYALSPRLFHWESQNATSPASPTGQRYVGHESAGSHVVLFTREAPKGEMGTPPFLCLGTAAYVEHRGERPMAVTWRLQRAMPADVVHAASAASA